MGQNKCIYCGSKHIVLSDGMYICRSCGESFEDSARGTDAEKERKIANLHWILWDTVHEEYQNDEAILAVCKDIKKIDPEDFQANFYEVAVNGSANKLNEFLCKIDIEEYRDYIRDVVEFVLRSLEKSNVNYLKALVERAFCNEERTEYYTRIEAEAEKVDSGVYEPSLIRHVFIAHSSADYERVLPIVEFLEGKGITCFVAQRNLRHGRGAAPHYAEKLEIAMRSTQCFLFFSSKNSRDPDCDAIKKEIPFVRDHLSQKARIEYLLDDYGEDDKPVKMTLANFFNGMEYCRTKEDLLGRLYSLVMGGERTAVKFCVRCGAENAEKVKFCGECGGKEFVSSKDDYYKIEKERAIAEALEKERAAHAEELKRIAEEAKKQREAARRAEEEKRKAEEEKRVQAEIAATETKRKEVENAESIYRKALKLDEKKKYAEAFSLYMQAALLGHASAQYNLGYCYKNGRGVTQSYEEAVKWYRKAAEQGDVDAQNNLGACYYSGQGVTQSYEEAVKWYRKAAEQGDASAQYNLGVCYYNGQGVTQSYEEAVKWYRKAAEQGHASAQYNLGSCYYNGQGVTKSDEEAVKWYRKAAEQGDAWAQYNLGVCYKNGRGVTQSYEEAVKWYRKAAEQGDEDAITALKRLEGK